MLSPCQTRPFAATDECEAISATAVRPFFRFNTGGRPTGALAADAIIDTLFPN